MNNILDKKKISRMIWICAIALLLCACGSRIPGVSEDEREEKAEEQLDEDEENEEDQSHSTSSKAEKAYMITEEPDGNAEYITLKGDQGTCYIRRPDDRTDDGYLSDEGAFRFEIPTGWTWGACELDRRLQSFYKGGDVPCLLWGVEDNDMGVNAFSENWEEVCASVKGTADAVFGEQLIEMTSGKYTLEDGQDVYVFWCSFYDKRDKQWTVSASYRFGEKNILEFISMNKGGKDENLENLALYTAATYEEYEGERYREYEGETVYKGMKIWDYKKLHNPFVLAYEQANGEVWRQEVVLSESENQVIEWKEDVLPSAIKDALEIEDREIMASDLTGIYYLAVVERQTEDFCIINEEMIYVNWDQLDNGDLLVQDIQNLKYLTSLYTEIGNISDFSPIGELEQLEELSIKAGRTVKDISFLDEMNELKVIDLGKAISQSYINSLSDELWRRTCSELEFSTFSKEYDGEKGLAFDELDLSDYISQ